jgi:hypothetical protein
MPAKKNQAPPDLSYFGRRCPLGATSALRRAISTALAKAARCRDVGV